MGLSIEDLERRIADLRAEMRKARIAGDQDRLDELGLELRDAEDAWDQAFSKIKPRRPAKAPAAPALLEPASGPSLVPFREQVHQALTLLTVPAAPRLIAEFHRAFFGSDLPSPRFTSLRRDEEKSFKSAPHSRPYYLCPALTVDRLAPVRALLSISTWSLADRMVGPLSPRVHFLTAAIKVADAVVRTPEPRPEARRLLIRFAANIPGGSDRATPAHIAKAARAELVVHEESDRITREEAAKRAALRLNDVQRLFGAPLTAVNAEEADAG